MLPPDLVDFLSRGGPTLWLIAALSVLTLALVLWKLWRLAIAGVWSGAATQTALADWERGAADAALSQLQNRRSLRAKLAATAMRTRLDPTLNDAQAREETTRSARADLLAARSGLRALELISTIAPLLGLLGTVLGMIGAFQALQEAGSRADPAALAGGIWEALLTTAAGMAVAIPAGVALVWFESLCDRLQSDMEDIATRIFIRGPKVG
jgi:biopolymer transport protein ExbB